MSVADNSVYKQIKRTDLILALAQQRDFLAFPAARESAARRVCRTGIASEQGKSAPSVPSLVAGQCRPYRRSGTVIECAVAARDGTLATAEVPVKRAAN